MLSDPTTVLGLDAVTLRRSGKEILTGVSLTVRKGEQWAILGPNGAGKSTILSLCGANVHPPSGTAHVLGEQIGRVEMQALRQRIGHVNPRHALSSPLTILEVALTGVTGTIETRMRWEPSADVTAHARELIDLLGLTGKDSALWPNLSQGERGRALIARALVNRPELLLLDEPTTGLDVAAREQLIDTPEVLAGARPDLTMMLVTHHLEELPAATTHGLLVSQGRIAATGPVHDVLTSANISDAFEYPIKVIYDDGRWGARTHRHP